MSIATARLVTSALFSGAAVVSFPRTLSPGRDIGITGVCSRVSKVLKTVVVSHLKLLVYFFLVQVQCHNKWLLHYSGLKSYLEAEP